MKTTRLLLQHSCTTGPWNTLAIEQNRSEFYLKSFALKLKKLDKRYGVSSRYRIIRETIETVPIFETASFDND